MERNPYPPRTRQRSAALRYGWLTNVRWAHLEGAGGVEHAVASESQAAFMTGYRESGIDLIQARGTEGRFEYKGVSLRLGVFNSDSGWYVGVHTSSGRLCARLSLEYAKSQKEAKDMLRYGFFLMAEESRDLIEHLQRIELLSVPALSTTGDNVSA